MRKVISIVATGVLAGLIGCGDGSNSAKGVDGGASRTGGVTSTGGTTTSPTGGSIVPDGCNLPSCMSGIMQGCAPSGTCTVQKSGLTDSNLCYSNGFKQVIKTNFNLTTLTGEMVVTMKKDNAVCYSLRSPVNATMDFNAPMNFNVSNAADTKIATMSIDLKAQKATVTCTGGELVALNDKCDKSMLPNISVLQGDIGTCTEGVCVP